MRCFKWFLVGLVGMYGPVWGAEIQVVGTTAYDSNVYEALKDEQAGFTSRVSVVAKGVAWRGDKGALQIEQQAGFKHMWVVAPGQTQTGDVFVEQFFMHGLVPVGKSGQIGIRTGLKFKQATRAPGEESYLRGVVDGDLAWRLGRHVTSRLRLGLGGDDSRDALLPETRYHSVGGDLGYAKSRNFSAHMRFLRRWITYGRAALVLDASNQFVSTGVHQHDVTTSWVIGGQLFAGMLIQADYALLRNQSNSFGYAYWAHRIQGMWVCHLGHGIDAQIFAQFHVRLYDENVSNLLGPASETDTYEQSIAVLKLSRQLWANQVIAGQYGFYRNGARQGDGFYRKHLFSISFETKM